MALMQSYTNGGFSQGGNLRSNKIGVVGGQRSFHDSRMDGRHVFEFTEIMP